jgi:signal transduction histidine kinase/ligand-binding sensor domain-containing protein
MKSPVKNSTLFGFLLLSILSAARFLPPVKAERLPVKIYTSADGLGSSFVDNLMRDSRGFMWFCTRDGLSRFDGARFVTYRIGDKDSPPGVESIFESSKGEYWITTVGGTFRFKPESELRSSELGDKPHARPTLNVEFVNKRRGGFYEDADKNLWFLSDELYAVEEREGKAAFKAVELNLPEKYAGGSLLGVKKTADGSFWLLTTFGAIRRLPDRRIVYYDAQLPLVETSFSLLEDNGGNIWLTRPNGLFVIKPEPLAALSQLPQFTARNLLQESLIVETADGTVRLPEKDGEIINYKKFDRTVAVLPKYLYKSADGHIWITTTQSLIEFDGLSFNVHSTTQGFTQEPGRMTEDLNGNLWIGGQSGAVRLDRGGMTTYNIADSPGQGRVRSIYQTERGEIFAFIGQGFISRFDGKDFRTVRMRIPPGNQFLWTSTGGFLDSRNQWWVLINPNLYRFPANQIFESLGEQNPLDVYDTGDGLPSNKMYCMFEDSKGNLFVSTRGSGEPSSDGLAQWLPDENKFRAFTAAENFPPNKSASSFAEDRAGNLWFGFYQGGAARYKNGRFTDFSNEINLPGGVITDIHLDRSGRLWFSSSSGGVIRLDDSTADEPKFVRMTIEDNLTSNNVRSITEDLYGRIYFGTVRGVDRLTPETGAVKHYSVNDGLATDFVDTAMRDRSGVLWFGTPSGISRLVPEKEGASQVPPILLGGLRVAGVEKKLSELGERSISNLEFAANQNNLQIDFFGIDFKASETLRYQFRLEGADADWSAPTEQRTVNYANLSPGYYRFTVRAVNAEGIHTPQPASISFKILSPVWARPWFVLLSLMTVSAIVIWLYRYRTARLREINQALIEANRAELALLKSREDRLAELERVRTRIATDLHDDIGASLTQIAILSEVAQAQNKKGNNGKSGGSAASEPLMKISSVSNELVEAMSDIVWSINPAKDHLHDLTQRMRRFASDVLSAKNINFQFLAPVAENDIAIGTNLRREVFLIFKESINNIIKHSRATKAIIEFRVADANLILAISDNGNGFAPASQVSATDGFYSSNEKGGNGILSMRRRAAEMNGSFEIVSEVGEGTKIILILPLEPAAQTGGGAPIEI